jgi:hypothetical protein
MTEMEPERPSKSKRHVPLSIVTLLVVGLIVTIEGGIFIWSRMPVAPSSAPVFFWPRGRTECCHSGNSGPVVAKYSADRGAECRMAGPNGTAVTAFYLEWDKVRADGMTKWVALHSIEICNMTIGYEFLGTETERRLAVPGQAPLIFDCARLSNKAGEAVFVFKTGWIQGNGSFQYHGPGGDRMERLKSSLARQAGAGRMLEAGVFGAQDADQAWRVFERCVLDELVWR